MFDSPPYLLFPAEWKEPAREGDTDAVSVYPDPYRVQPGEEVTFNFSAISWVERSGDRETARTIARPFIDGKPIAAYQWNFMSVTQGRNYRGSEHPVNARKQFTIEAPDTPGIYNLMVGGWRDVYRKAFEGLPRERNRAISYDTTYTGSNVIRLEVAEPTPAP